LKKRRIAIVIALVVASGAAEARGGHPAGGPAARNPGRSAPDVVAEAQHWLGAGNMTGLGGPWCASFASYVLRRTGRAPLANGLASSALSYGRRLAQPKVGALAVVSTRFGYAAHVGFVARVNADGSIELVSGNWGHRVADATVSRRIVVAFVDVK